MPWKPPSAITTIAAATVTAITAPVGHVRVKGSRRWIRGCAWPSRGISSMPHA